MDYIGCQNLLFYHLNLYSALFYFIYCFGPVKLLELSRDGAPEQKIENRNTVKT